MYVLVETYSDVDVNLDGTFRGESLWGVNLAKCLAKYGHKIVLVIKNGRLRTIVNKENITIVPYHQLYKLEDKSFDASFQIANVLSEMPPGRFDSDGIISKCKLFGYFTTVPKSKTTLSFEPNDVLVHPGLLYTSTEERDDVLPIPMGDFQPSKFNNRRIAWTAKDAIYQYNSKLSVADGIGNWLEAINEAKGSLKIEMLSLTADEIRMSHNLHVPKYSVMTQSRFHKELARFSVSVPLRWSGSLLDSVFLGLVPIVTREWLDGYIDQSVLNDLSKNRLVSDFNKEAIHEEFKTLINDPNEFNRRLDLLRTSLEPHTDAKVHQRFLDLVSKYS